MGINGPRRYFRTCTRRLNRSLSRDGSSNGCWSANNRLIALLQLHERAKGRPELLEDVHMMSFRQWDKEHGRRVKKGERAIWILAPRTRRVEEEAADGSRASRTIVTGFTTVPVFNITQTEGPDLPPAHPFDPAPGDERPGALTGAAGPRDCRRVHLPRAGVARPGRRTAPGPSVTPTRSARSSSSTHD